MSGRIYRELRPVRRRQRELLLMRSASFGLLAGSLGGIGLGIWRWSSGQPIPAGSVSAILLGGPVLGLIVGALWRQGWHDAAAAIDTQYGLKDRIVTALDFLRRNRATPLHELEVADAEAHLSVVKATEVAPFRLPRVLPYACGALALALAMLAWPLAGKKVAAGPLAPIPEIVAEATKIGEDLKALDELAKNERDKELQELVKQLKEKADELKQPGVDEREALAKLSEMQAAIAAQQAQYNVGLVDGQLQSLGDAMVPADSLEAAGHALQEGKFEQAAQELEKLDDPELDRKEAKAVEEKLKQVAESMGDAGLGQMSEAATQMAEGLKGGANKSKFKKGTKAMASSARSHGRRRRIKEILDAELDNLNESKGKMRDSNRTTRYRRPERSKNPSSDWGAGISGNEGPPTNLAANRQQEELTGNPGEGPSEMETTHSPEGRQSAARGYREKYQKYRKMSESVLDSEPIPLGHRETIRKYFELIRPQSGESEKDAAGSKPAK
jgi:hypothetical protein